MKRFTSSEKWASPWFRKLPPRLKLLWLWLCDNCDSAGVIDFDSELASFQIGETVESPEIKAFDGRVVELENGKLLVVKFVQFQYGVLSADCRPHAAILKKIESHGIADMISSDTLSKGYPKGIDTLEDKDKEKEQEKEQDKTPPIPKKKKEPAQTDEEWIAGLQSVLAYEHLNVAAEYSRAKVWCQSNNRQCTRRFFTNWINRASDNKREIVAQNPVAQQPAKPKDTRTLDERHWAYWQAAEPALSAIGETPMKISEWLRAGKPEN